MKDRNELAKSFYGQGVELGVAGGAFSRAILRAHLGAPHVTRLWSIDRWADHHGLAEYRMAAEMLARAGHGRCIPLRMTFDEALPLFDDASLDFIYIDGYAHTGQEGGKTLADWWAKLKPGGMFAGHDFHPKWPLTVQAVRRFADAYNFEFQTTEDERYPSWYGQKPTG